MLTQTLNLKQFIQSNHLLYRRLCFWAKKRGSQTPEAEVHEYLTELIFEASKHDHEALLQKWTKVLLPQERIELINRSPILISDFSVGGKWYQLEKGEYSVVREEIIHEIYCGGQRQGVISRNRYDCLILNCPELLIIDVDICAPKDSEIQDCALSCRRVSSERQAIAVLERFTGKNPQFGFRVYRTRNGLRHLCTTHPFDPLDSETNRLMKDLYADPLYARLCRFQATFRARLTPKPWRLSEDYIEDKFFYDRTTGLVLPDLNTYAVGHLIAVIGCQKTLPQFEYLIRVHDSYCRHDRLEFELA